MECPETVFAIFRQEIVSNADQPCVIVNGIIFTEAQIGVERNALCTYADADATAQWQQLKQNPDFETKFDVNKISDMVEDSDYHVNIILNMKDTRKMLEDHFFATISTKEAENEVEFATF